MTQLATNGAANRMDQLAAVPERQIVVEDTSQFSNFLDTGRFTQLQRAARMFSESCMVPAHYQSKLGDCFIAMQMAMRLGIDPLMFMQNTHIVHGKPGMEGKLVIALINSSGLYAGPLQFRIDGTGDDYGCTAWAKNKETGEIVEGPKVTFRMVKAEGWNKNGKWSSMADLMYRYRAGAFFGRVQCPERLMGMQTVEEIEDVVGPARQVDSSVVSSAPRQSLAEKLADPEPAIDVEATPAKPATAKQESPPADDSVTKIPFNDFVKLAGDKLPVDYEPDQLTPMLSKFLRQYYTTPDTKGKPLPTFWGAMTAEQHGEVRYALEAGTFPWKELK